MGMTWLGDRDTRDQPHVAKAGTAVRAGETLVNGRFAVEGAADGEPPGRYFAARDRITRQPATVRLIRLRDAPTPEALRRLRQDVRRVASSPHPYILRMLEAAERDDALLVVTEPRAITLRTMLGVRQLSRDEIYTFARQIAAALAFAHAQGVAHGTLTPATVELVASDPPPASGQPAEWHPYTARLAEFGLAHVAPRFLEPFPFDLPACASYLAPEEARPSAHTLDPAFAPTTDIYHFGALLWEMTTGAPPRDLVSDLFAAQDLPPALHAIVSACLQLDPRDRATDLTAIVTQLRLAQRALHGQTHPRLGAESRPLTQAHFSGRPDRETPSRLSVVTTPRLGAHLPPARPEDAPTSTLPAVATPQIPVIAATKPASAPSPAAPALGPDNPTRPLLAPPDAPTRPRQAVKRRNTFGRLRAGSGHSRRWRPVRRAVLIATLGVGILALAVVASGFLAFSRINAAPSASDPLALRQGVVTLPARATPYLVARTLVLTSGETLRVAPGATLAFASGAALVIRGGVLDARGTAEAPILFTAAADVAPPGTPAATPGAWPGVQLAASPDGSPSRALLEYVTVRYAGVVNGAALTCDAGALAFTNGVQSDSAGAGLHAGNDCWGEVAQDTFERDAAQAAVIATTDLRFQDNTLLGLTAALP